MLQALSNHAEGERLHASDRLVWVLAIRQYAWQGRNFGEPAAIVFSFDFNRERHQDNVPFGLAV